MKISLNLQVNKIIRVVLRQIAVMQHYKTETINIKPYENGRMAYFNNNWNSCIYH